MAAQWYYLRDGQQRGPVSSKELKTLVSSGRLGADDLVWREGLESWVPASKVNGLFDSSRGTDGPAASSQNVAAPPKVDPREVRIFEKSKSRDTTWKYQKRRSFTGVGWLSIIYGALSITGAAVGFFLILVPHPVIQIALSVFSVVGTILSNYILWSLKWFLNSYFNFHRADIVIVLNIIISLITAIHMVFSLIDMTSKELVDPNNILVNVWIIIAMVFIFICDGSVMIGLGVKLLALPNNLNGLLKPYCYTTIAAGFCLISFVLVNVAVLLAAISSLILGIIFLRTADTVRDSFHAHVRQ